jgi:hypothetical protein
MCMSIYIVIELNKKISKHNLVNVMSYNFKYFDLHMFLNSFVLFLVINCVFYLFVKTSSFNLFDYIDTYTFLFSIKILQTTITSMEKRG